MKESKDLDALYQAILSLETPEECKSFFDDLCTIPELHSLAQRWAVAKLLHEGSTFNEIMAKLGASSATISRVNRCLHYGSGGYQALLNRKKD